MTGRRGFALVVITLLAAVVTASLVSTSRPPAATPQERAHRLDQQLRCPVCEGLSVADSPSSTAQAIAADVRRRVDAGQSDREIRAYYVGRYGPGILLAPSGADARLVWLTPIVAVGLAVVLLGAAFRRWTRRAPVVLEVEDEALVAAERARWGGREEAR